MSFATSHYRIRFDKVHRLFLRLPRHRERFLVLSFTLIFFLILISGLHGSPNLLGILLLDLVN